MSLSALYQYFTERAAVAGKNLLTRGSCIAYPVPLIPVLAVAPLGKAPHRHCLVHWRGCIVIDALVGNLQVACSLGGQVISKILIIMNPLSTLFENSCDRKSMKTVTVMLEKIFCPKPNHPS